MIAALRRYGYHVFLVALIVVCTVGLAGCDDGAQEAPAPVEQTDTTGTYGPMIGTNGKIGFGIDLGGGISLNPATGGIGFGF